MNASIRGVLFVKADRINKRVNDYEKQFLKEMKSKGKEKMDLEDFIEYMRGIRIIVDTELNEKGVERKWRT